MHHRTTTVEPPARDAVVGYRERLAIPPIESPFLEELLADSALPAGTQQDVRRLARDGYLVIDLDLPDLTARAERIVAAMGPRYDGEGRVAEAWYWDEDVRALACAPQILDVLSLLYQRDPIPFQTLNFEHGSEQPVHSDAIHFHSMPRHYMCGVWIALEDVHDDAGPLIGYPGSHTWPDIDMSDLGVPADPGFYGCYESFIRDVLEVRGAEPERLLLRRGQAVLWLTNFLHGGTPIRDPARTRHSMVTHYYFEGCQYYFPMASDLSMGQITRREVIDIRTGRFVPHRHGADVIELGDLSKVCTYPRPLPDWVR